MKRRELLQALPAGLPAVWAGGVAARAALGASNVSAAPDAARKLLAAPSRIGDLKEDVRIRPHDLIQSLMADQALVFDVFGTVVDWRTSLAEAVAPFAQKKGVAVDGSAFATAWVNGYASEVTAVRDGQAPWTPLEPILRAALDPVLAQFSLTALNASERDSLAKAWRALSPWPDSVEGLTRLKKKYLIAPLSNANLGLMTWLSKRAGLPWDCILSAELAKTYKPNPAVYLTAASTLGLEPKRMVMVAAHKYDLLAAKALGFRTAYVRRPLEYGPTPPADLFPDPQFTWNATDLTDLAEKMNA